MVPSLAEARQALQARMHPAGQHRCACCTSAAGLRKRHLHPTCATPRHGAAGRFHHPRQPRRHRCPAQPQAPSRLARRPGCEQSPAQKIVSTAVTYILRCVWPCCLCPELLALACTHRSRLNAWLHGNGLCHHAAEAIERGAHAAEVHLPDALQPASCSAAVRAHSDPETASPAARPI
jgi:hypothetical protein